jgi:DNA-binding MarR family transcriptional regulator
LARPSDKERIIWLLSEEGGTSNQQVKATLGLDDSRYKNVLDELRSEGLVEKYRCHGGGIRLTSKGLKQKPLSQSGSAVDREVDLYLLFQNALIYEAQENEENATVLDTSTLRMRRKWSNPDLAKISVQRYPIQRLHKVVLITYEVKQWGRWNVEAVFEAASHRRYAHEAYVVLEWARDVPFEGAEYIESACSRFGVGLITLHPYYSSFRHIVRIHAVPHMPPDGEVEEYMGYIFERRNGDFQAYEALWSQP